LLASQDGRLRKRHPGLFALGKGWEYFVDGQIAEAYYGPAQFPPGGSGLLVERLHPLEILLQHWQPVNLRDRAYKPAAVISFFVGLDLVHS